jgi:hypothetical protein
MTARAAAFIAAAFVLCGGFLSGCVAVPPPQPSDDDAIAAFNESMLSMTWQNTGLDTITERPRFQQGPALEQSPWLDATFACMTEQGLGNYGLGFSPGSGFELYGPDSSTAQDPSDLLAFYTCVAANALVPDEGFSALSDEQLDYIYDYYQDWLVPCVIMQGYHFTDVPSRIEFRALGGQWRPFYSVDISISGADYEELERLCGAERPQLY